MGKNLQVMDDPVLDRIFSDAYRETLKQVDTLERQKSLKDRYEALTDLFERDLYSRDLSYQEREQFVQVFRDYIANAEERIAERKDQRRRTTGLSIAATLLAMVLAGAIIVGVYRPFTSEAEVTDQLNTLIAKVDEGYGEYSKEYYRTLDRFSRKLGPDKVAQYEDRMYAELDEGFTTYVAQLEAGQIALYDDTRKWANYFPDREERKARRELAQNALVAGFGGAMEQAAESVIDGVKELVGKGAEIVRERAAEIGAGTTDADSSANGGEPSEESSSSESGSF